MKQKGRYKKRKNSNQSESAERRSAACDEHRRRDGKRRACGVGRRSFFIGMREIANVIYRTTSYKKKARIVLEYDPHQEKMTLSTFTEDAEQPEKEN